MSNKRRLGRDRTVHAVLVNTLNRALCTRSKTRRVTDDPMLVTCEACGKAAVAALERLQQEAEAQDRQLAASRQEAALAANAPLRWWEKNPDA